MGPSLTRMLEAWSHLGVAPRVALVSWTIAVAAWLLLHLAAWRAGRRVAAVRVSRTFPARRRWRDWVAGVGRLTGLPALSRLWRPPSPAAETCPIDAALGTGRWLRGRGLTPLLALLLYALGAAAVALLAGRRWWPLAAAVPLLLPAGAILPRLAGLLGHQRRLTGRRRQMIDLVASVEAAATDWSTATPPRTAADWLALGQAATAALTEDEVFLCRLRCLDRALAAAGEDTDQEAIEAAERVTCRARLGLPEHGSIGERAALLLTRSPAAETEAQARLLVAHLAGDRSEAAWRARAEPLAYRLLEALAPRLDEHATARLWSRATAASQDQEQRLRVRERIVAEQRAGVAPEPLVTAALAGCLPSSRRLDRRLACSPPVLRGIGLEPAEARVTWFREPRLPRSANPPPALSVPATAELLQSTWRAATPAERDARVALLASAWAADPRRGGPQGLVELASHLADDGLSPVAAAALAGLAEASARYLGEAAVAALEALSELVAGLDPRVAWRPRVAVARAWSRFDSAAGARRLGALLDELLERPRSAVVHAALVAVLEALAGSRAPDATARLLDAARRLAATRSLGYLQVEEARAEVIGAVPRGKWLVVTAAAAAARRGVPEGSELLDQLVPTDTLLKGDQQPAAESFLALLAAAGGGQALERAMAVARRLAGGSPADPAVADRRVRRLLERAAAGWRYRALTDLALAASTPPLGVWLGEG